MLSNCKVIHVLESEEMPFHLFESTDYSMSCPRQYSIRTGDVILCEKHNLLPEIESGDVSLKPSDCYVVTCYFEKEFVARISSIDEDRERVTFSFISPAPQQHADQVLWFHEIRSIYKVNSVQSKIDATEMKGDAAV